MAHPAPPKGIAPGRLLLALFKLCPFIKRQLLQPRHDAHARRTTHDAHAHAHATFSTIRECVEGGDKWGEVGRGALALRAAMCVMRRLVSSRNRARRATYASV